MFSIKVQKVIEIEHKAPEIGFMAINPAFEFGAKKDDPVEMYLEDIFTIATNLAGLPGISIPCGLVDKKPVGIQIIGNYFREALILNVAHQYQTITDWHQNYPKDEKIESLSKMRLD